MEKAEIEAPAPEDPPQRGGATETILLVEDEGIVRTTIHSILTGQGYAVLDAARGSEALALAQSYGSVIHLILTDVVMPGMSGMETASRIREILPDIKVLYMSAHMDHALDSSSPPHPIAPLIQKPFRPNDLAAKVREALDGALESA